MVKLVDTLVSGTSVRKDVQVRVLFRAQKKAVFELRQPFFYKLESCVLKGTYPECENIQLSWKKHFTRS